MVALAHTHWVAYFADGTSYSYSTAGSPMTFNAGWLDEGHPYPIGPVPTEFIRRLIVLSENPVMCLRGWHQCNFCPPPEWASGPPRMLAPGEAGSVCRFEGEEWKVFGNGEIRVAETTGVCWAAPQLVVHYVLSHGYLPPPGFVAAVLTGRRPPNPKGAWQFLRLPVPVSLHEEMRGRALAFLVSVEDRLPSDIAQLVHWLIDTNEACLAVQVLMRDCLVKPQVSLTADEQTRPPRDARSDGSRLARPLAAGVSHVQRAQRAESGSVVSPGVCRSKRQQDMAPGLAPDARPRLRRVCDSPMFVAPDGRTLRRSAC